MRELMKTMKEQLVSGEDLVLVTVTAAHGATPRGAGARMLVNRTGRLCGTIGGGAVEYRSEKIAAEVLKEKASKEHDFSLTRDDVEQLGMICGGAVNVYFHFIPGNDREVIALCDKAEEAFINAEDLWLISDIGLGGKLSLAQKTGGEMDAFLTRQPCRINDENKNIYIEQISTSGRVYIFGCGHVGQELEPVLTHVGFRCTVMDDRPEFAKRELFPSADEVKVIDFNHISDYISIGENDYAVVMTRGHAFDTVVQAQVLPCRPCYVGVIGSRHKAAGVRQDLHDNYGVSDADLDLVTTPIGMEIKAETPAEIAISIAGEMILRRAQLNQM